VLENERGVDQVDGLHVGDLLRQVKATKFEAAGMRIAAPGIKLGRIQIYVDAIESVPSGDSNDGHGCRLAKRQGVHE
jgi:hypothetical protein